MTEDARERLIQDLSAYHHRKGHAVTVVFDGWREGFGTEEREFRSGVEVRFSRRGETADHVIRRLVEEWGRECAVVSSDREVASHARGAGAFVMGAQEFLMRLAEEPSRPGASLPWKKAEEPDDGRSRRPPDKKGNGRKLPKAFRTRQRKLKEF